MMMENLKTYCSINTERDKSFLYYKGLMLCEVAKPNMNSSLMVYPEFENGKVNIIVSEQLENDKKPVKNVALTFDSATEFERFRNVPFDPKFRGLYPLKDRIMRAYLIECSKEFSKNKLRVYIDMNLMASIIHGNNSANIEQPNIEKFFNDLSSLFGSELKILSDSGKCFKSLNTVLLNYNGITVRVTNHNDEFGDVLIIEPMKFLFESKIQIERYSEKKSKDLIITINGVVFDYLKYNQSTDTYSSRYSYYKHSSREIKRMKNKNFISFALYEEPGQTFSSKIADKINLSKFYRSMSIPNGFELFKSEDYSTLDIDGLQYIDYEEYLKEEE